MTGNTIRFTPGQQAVIDGTVNAFEILNKKSGTEKKKWRIEQIKLIVRSKPSGFLFTNEYFKDRLGWKDPNGFWAFKNTESFKRTFTLTPKIGTHKFELAIKGDAKLVAMTEATYKKPEPTSDGEGTDKTAPELPQVQSANPNESLLNLAKQVALERLAREMTVGEVLDGAKEYGL